VMVFVPQLPARPFSRGKIVHHLRYSVHDVTVASASILLPSQQQRQDGGRAGVRARRCPCR
jgi:hypothetical protein